MILELAQASTAVPGSDAVTQAIANASATVEQIAGVLLLALGVIAELVRRYRAVSAQVRAVIQGVEEAAAADPSSAAVVKAAIKRTATELGVEPGLRAEVERRTRRLERPSPPEVTP